MSDHEFEIKTEVTYRGLTVPVEFHDSQYDNDTRFYEQVAFMAGVDLVLDALDPEPKIEVSVYATRDYGDVNTNDVWHHTEGKILFLEPSGVYTESWYDPASATETGFRLVGKKTVARSDFEVGGRP